MNLKSNSTDPIKSISPMDVCLSSSVGLIRVLFEATRAEIGKVSLCKYNGGSSNNKKGSSRARRTCRQGGIRHELVWRADGGRKPLCRQHSGITFSSFHRQNSIVPVPLCRYTASLYIRTSTTVVFIVVYAYTRAHCCDVRRQLRTADSTSSRMMNKES